MFASMWNFPRVLSWFIFASTLADTFSLSCIWIDGTVDWAYYRRLYYRLFPRWLTVNGMGALIVSGTLLASLFLFQPETYEPGLLRWKANHLRRMIQGDSFKALMELDNQAIFRRRM